MITSIRHKGLRKFYADDDHRGILVEFAPRIERVLDRFGSCSKPDDMNLPGSKFHQLKGDRKECYAVSISRNWRITFKFDGKNVVDVDVEDYH